MRLIPLLSKATMPTPSRYPHLGIPISCVRRKIRRSLVEGGMQGRRRQFRATEREGIAQVAFLVSRLGWIWREQPIADFGVDGYIEIVKDKMPSGELIGVQVKAGKYYFKSKGPVCRLKVTNEHMEYWSHHNLSIIVILYNPETKSTIWEWARVEYARAAKNGWIIEVPKNQEFSRSADWNLRNSQHTSSSIALRRRFALDIELIKKFSKHDIYISVSVPTGGVRGRARSRQVERSARPLTPPVGTLTETASAGSGQGEGLPP